MGGKGARERENAIRRKTKNKLYISRILLDRRPHAYPKYVWGENRKKSLRKSHLLKKIFFLGFLIPQFSSLPFHQILSLSHLFPPNNNNTAIPKKTPLVPKNA